MRKIYKGPGRHHTKLSYGSEGNGPGERKVIFAHGHRASSEEHINHVASWWGRDGVINPPFIKYLLRARLPTAQTKQSPRVLLGARDQLQHTG